MFSKSYQNTIIQKPKLVLSILVLILILCVFAAIAMMVSIQLANDEATKSVGEKVLPKPWLSIGASVNILVSESKWVISVLKSPL